MNNIIKLFTLVLYIYFLFICRKNIVELYSHSCNEVDKMCSHACDITRRKYRDVRKIIYKLKKTALKAVFFK